MIGTNIIRLCKDRCSDNAELPPIWSEAFLSVQTGYVGIVRSTSHTTLEVGPFENGPSVSGFARKITCAEEAVTEQSHMPVLELEFVQEL